MSYKTGLTKHESKSSLTLTGLLSVLVVVKRNRAFSHFSSQPIDLYTHSLTHTHTHHLSFQVKHKASFAQNKLFTFVMLVINVVFSNKRLSMLRLNILFWKMLSIFPHQQSNANTIYCTQAISPVLPVSALTSTVCNLHVLFIYSPVVLQFQLIVYNCFKRFVPSSTFTTLLRPNGNKDSNSNVTGPTQLKVVITIKYYPRPQSGGK